MSRRTIAVEHNFECAHRLPILPGKCQNVHGHSFLAKFFVSAELDENGVSVDYGILKKIVRGFIDTNWDHGTALGVSDPLVYTLWGDPYHTKTYVFGKTEESEEYPWPTVEAFAHVAAKHIQKLLNEELWKSDPCVERVEVRETAVNFGIWDRSVDG